VECIDIKLLKRRIETKNFSARLTQFLSFLYSNYIMDERDLSNIEVDVNDALLTLIVDQVVLQFYSSQNLFLICCFFLY